MQISSGIVLRLGSMFVGFSQFVFKYFIFDRFDVQKNNLIIFYPAVLHDQPLERHNASCMRIIPYLNIDFRIMFLSDVHANVIIPKG